MPVLKLGGSVITVKDEPMVADHGGIKRLSGEVAASGLRRLVVVHGGGSFGHPVAERFGLAGGLVSGRQVLGFAMTRQAMAKLNGIVVDALIAESVPAVSAAPSSFIVTDGGRIASEDFHVVRTLLDRGLVPVLHGDAVLDRSTGFAILSGDQLAVRLAVALGSPRLIFGVDVDGVYTSDPKVDPAARLIERLSLDELRSLEVGGARVTDVTGGMLGKVSEAAAAVEAGVEVLIANASRPGVILKALRGDPVTGTIVER